MLLNTHFSRVIRVGLITLSCIALASASSAQVVQPIDPVNPPDGFYSYAVKFVCGFQARNTGILNTPNGPINDGEPTVKAGNYATDINIYNPGPETAEVEKKVLFLVEQGEPKGREPEFVEPSAFDQIGLPPMTATMDDCNRLQELSPTSNPFGLRIGFLVITSKQPLDVTAVYTSALCSDWTITGPGQMCSTPFGINGISPFSSSLSIDVEQVAGRFILQ